MFPRISVEPRFQRSDIIIVAFLLAAAIAFGIGMSLIMGEG